MALNCFSPYGHIRIRISAVPTLEGYAIHANPYIFRLTRQYYGKSNMAFSDEHVEHISLRDWPLPIESVHRSWHYASKARLDHLVYRDADN